MATAYSKIQRNFWETDEAREMTPEEKYFWMYLQTNANVNTLGCYAFRMRKAMDETGYNRETLEKLLQRMEQVLRILYDEGTKEVFLLHWAEGNWNKKTATLRALAADLKEVESVEVSLLNRCLGYNADIKKHMKVKKPMQGADGKVLMDENGKVITEEVLEEVTEQQHVPADVGAIKFYLLNKAKDKWKENPDRLELEKKRVANDTKRTKLAEQAASGGGVSGKTIEEILEEAESGGADAEV